MLVKTYAGIVLCMVAIPGRRPCGSADVTFVATDNVDLQLSDSLAGRAAVIEPDIETVGCWGERGSKVPKAPVDPGHEAAAFRPGSID